MNPELNAEIQPAEISPPDITDLLDRLHASAEAYRLMIESVRDYAIFRLDPQGRVATWNSGAERIKGYKPEEIIGRHFSIFYPPDALSAKVPENALAAAISEGRTELEGWRLRKDGSLFFANVIISAIRDVHGRLIGFTKVTRDITAQKKSEEIMQESEERFRKFFEEAPIGQGLVSPEGRWIRVNHVLCAMIGYTESELLATNFQSITHPDDLENDLNYVHDLIAGKIQGYQMEKRYYHRRGHIVHVLLSVSLLRSPEGRPLYFISQIQDISDRKAAEFKIAEQTAELRRSNQDLEQFAYVASHDMQEPLRAIAGFAHILRKNYGDKFDDRANRMMTQILDGASRMSRIIQDLLSLARIGAQKAPLQITPLSVPLGLAMDSLAVVIRERGAAISQSSLPALPVDAEQISLLFQNLIANAIKFCPHRLPEIHISARNLPEEGAWRISVRDNGMGIDPKYFTEIFGIFQRLHSREEFAGTGIGLAICKRIVERHGGQIWVESVPQAGTIFHFTLLETKTS